MISQGSLGRNRSQFKKSTIIHFKKFFHRLKSVYREKIC
jgi:hypothetical protein